MKPSRLLLASTVVLLAVALALAATIQPSRTAVNQPHTHTLRQTILLGQHSPKPGTAALDIQAAYTVKVYRHGELVAERNKTGDPVTIQFYRAIANELLGLIAKGSPQIYYLESGTAVTEFDTEFIYWKSSSTWVHFAPVPNIAIGTGSTASHNDYSLIGLEQRNQASMTVTDNGTAYIVFYTASFTITKSFSLGEVGLELYDDFWQSGTRYRDFLLVAHDIVSPPVSLVPGDVVSVTYEIVLPYSTNGPFTKTFYGILITYVLGVRGLQLVGGQATGVSVPITDEDGNTVAYDVGPHGFRIEIGDGQPSSSPFVAFKLSSLLASEQITDSRFVASYVEGSNNITITYLASFQFTSSASITEIGLGIMSDKDPGTGEDDTWYLLAYWPLSSPVSVSPGDALRVEIEIVIPYAG